MPVTSVAGFFAPNARKYGMKPPLSKIGFIYDPKYISDIFKKAITDFGRPELSLHKLRHTCASLLIEKGWDPKRVQYWMGHADIQTTLNIYAHYNRQRMTANADDLEVIANASAGLF